MKFRQINIIFTIEYQINIIFTTENREVQSAKSFAVKVRFYIVKPWDPYPSLQETLIPKFPKWGKYNQICSAALAWNKQIEK